MYSVFVSREAAPDALMTEMIYHDSSLRRAQVAFAQAVMTRRDVYAVEIHRDLDLLVRVHIERP